MALSSMSYIIWPSDGSSHR